MIYKILSKKDQKALVCLLLGSLILSIGINLFIAPHSLAFGGVTGMTILIQSLTGIPIFVSNLILSLAVISLGWCELGHDFMVKTIIPTMVLPVFLYLTTPLSRIEMNLPISAIAGAITVGVGISLTIFAGGSTAGPDTIGLVLKEHFNIPITITMLVIDVLVILCGLRVYGTRIAVWSVGVAVLMNLTVKFMRNILSRSIVFRYCDKYISDGIVGFKG